MKKEIRKVPAYVGMQSCVGINTSRPFPLSFGNYFGLAIGIRVLNFWAENLEQARQRFLPDNEVQVHQWTWHEEKYGEVTACLIVDERIPADWYHNRLCFTGFGRPPKEVAAEMYALLGDPENEMEYWSDAEMYYARRGQKYKEGDRCVRWCPNDKPEDLVAALLKSRETQ